MASAHEQLTEQFRLWETRGRGWQVFDEPVNPEPLFVPFRFNAVEVSEDDGRRPTFLSSLVQGLSLKLAAEPEASPALLKDDEAEPVRLERQPPVELQISLPPDFDAPRRAFDQFLQSVSLSTEPLSFELLGLHNRMVAQLAVGREDLPRVRKQMEAFCPEATLIEADGLLASVWTKGEDGDSLVVEFGLGQEFMLPLAEPDVDPFVGIAAALNGLQDGEIALFQVLYQPLQRQWAEAIREALEDSAGKPLFVNRPELTKAAVEKTSQPLYAAVVRVAVRANDYDRVLAIARDVASALRVFAHPTGNELIPLRNDKYPFEAHVEDMLLRQTRRSGMILNSDELLGFVHLPSAEVPKLAREIGKTKAAPKSVRSEGGLMLGHNAHAGKTVEVRLSPEQRVRHTHIVGASGTGKSTLLFDLIRQDIENGEGLAVLDPHGDLVEKVLSIIPPERIDDVVLVDPSDEQYSVGFNILSAHSELEKNLLASDLVSVFQRLSTSWGDQMNSVLQNAILAFLESDRRGTLADLRRFLIESPFRNEFLKSVRDAEVVYYWQKSFPHLSGNKSIGSILTRLDTFLAQKPIRHMVSQPENRLDFARIMDSSKIFLAKLPEGLLGRENSHLLGTLLVSKFQQIAMSRQAQQITARRDFWLYIDEFANFITPSMAEILSGARKYRIGLTLAHHELHQLQRNSEVASAVMSHPFTRIVFRVGDEDAKKLGEGFSFFEAKDLRNLETGQAIVRVERSDFDFNLTVPLPEKLDEAETTKRRQEVINCSREKYGTAKADVETLLAQSRETVPQDKTSPLVTPVAEPPKDPEAPKAALPPPTIETKPPEVLPPLMVPESKPIVVLERKTPGVPADLGKGGEQHKAIQRRIKEAAETLGFRSVIEKQIAGSQESVDLLLERSDQRIACEISISTTIDHEVGNVSKCLKAGLPQVAIICVETERLRKIAAAVSGSLGADAAARVSYHQPDAFIAHLKSLPVPVPKASETIHHGYKVKRSAPKLTVEEQRQREDIANRMMAEAMRPNR